MTINAGIGDMILCHAMLSSAGFEEVEVSINEEAVSVFRSDLHLEFAHRLASQIFTPPVFRLVSSPRDLLAGLTPQCLAVRYGLRPAVPDLRAALSAADDRQGEGHVAVTTKVRGWPRSQYEAVRGEFLALLRSLRLPVVLVGERRVGMMPEYQIHGESLVYSIYEDLRPLAAADETVPEFGVTPPSWDRFVADCTIMRNAALTVTLGSGGNVSMGFACGRQCLSMIGGTEMGTFMAAMPADDRLILCPSVDKYLAELSRWSA